MTHFISDNFERIQGDLASGRIPLGHISLSDPEARKLKVMIPKSGPIYFQVKLPDQQRVNIGQYPAMSLDEARGIAARA